MKQNYWKTLLLSTLLLVTACDLRNYPDDYNDDNDQGIQTADSVVITFAPIRVVGLDSLAFEVTAFTWRYGEPRPGLKAYWRVLQLDEAAGYFLNPTVESVDNPPGKAIGLFVSDQSPSGSVQLIVEPVPGSGGDTATVILHKNPLLTLPPDTSMTDTTISLELPVSLQDDRQHPLVEQILGFSAYPTYGVVTAYALTDQNGEALIYFDAEENPGTYIISGWLQQFQNEVRDTVLIDVQDTGL